MVLAFSSSSHLKRVQALKNGTEDPLGPLLDLSWARLGTLWGGVFGPLGSFGIALGRLRASQISGRGCAKAQDAPLGCCRGDLLTMLRASLQQLGLLDPFFVATMLSEDDFR